MTSKLVTIIQDAEEIRKTNGKSNEKGEITQSEDQKLLKKEKWGHKHQEIKEKMQNQKN